MSSSFWLWVINPSPSMSRVPCVALIGRLRPYSRLLRFGTYIVLKLKKHIWQSYRKMKTSAN